MAINIRLEQLEMYEIMVFHLRLSESRVLMAGLLVLIDWGSCQLSKQEGFRGGCPFLRP